MMFHGESSFNGKRLMPICVVPMGWESNEHLKLISIQYMSEYIIGM